jgi:DNA (cytosine-5)-methyltransferase 1
MDVSADTTMLNPEIQAIDVFCGIGGLTFGIQAVGIDVVAGIDNDGTCEHSYVKNNKGKFINSDINKLDFEDLKLLFSDGAVRVVVGCAPCQPFSSHSNKNVDRESDERWGLILKFADLIDTLNPDVISMENVRGLTKTQIFRAFIKRLSSLGYFIDYRVVYCPDYGIPQRRSRLVLLGSKLGEIKVPMPTHDKSSYVTVADTIKGLPIIRAGSTCKKDVLHRSMNLSSINMKRIKASRQNGTWKEWNRELLPECYLRESGSTYTAVYGRMSWNDVAPTITTQFFNYGSGRFGHPTQSRALSIREGSLLQTFPRDYIYNQDLSINVLGRQIGNAVPPRLGEVIGYTIKEHIDAYSGRVYV